MVNFVLRIRHKAEWYWKTRALRICPGTKNRKGRRSADGTAPQVDAESVSANLQRAHGGVGMVK
ncbi:hypothetical protein E8E15_003529 [Penicillium rubens]|nr:hypothetical protein E8E15_003529 [Penicillium rubens]